MKLQPPDLDVWIWLAVVAVTLIAGLMAMGLDLF